MKELFEQITKIIASPHTIVTNHNKRQAAIVFLALQDYVLDHWDDENGRVVVKEEDLDCESYAAKIIDELESLK